MKNFLEKAKRKTLKVSTFLSGLYFAFMTSGVATYAGSGADKKTAKNIQDVLSDFVGIIAIIFQTIGVIIAIYSAGQLILAFRNDDANSKSSAGTQLAVGLALIFFPLIITNLDLISRITGI